MKTQPACSLCKDTGVVVFASESPNLIDSRWCHQCGEGANTARLIDSIVARTLGKVRAV